VRRTVVALHRARDQHRRTVNTRPPLSRREILRITAAVGGLSALAPWMRALAALEPTPQQTMGPFYPKIRPLDEDMDLTLLKGRTGRAKGRIVHLTGRVLDAKGEPVAGAQVEIWQANAAGRYDHPSDTNPAPLDPGFQGFGTQLTDALGRYRFKTIRPGAYPMNAGNPDNVRPPHIHFAIEGRRDRLVTQMYFPGDPLNTRDRIFMDLGARQRAAIGRIVTPPNPAEADALHVAWDIVLRTG
jgi:protocatechuate 3,4-dioxygenase, beta subunit